MSLAEKSLFNFVSVGSSWADDDDYDNDFNPEPSPPEKATASEDQISPPAPQRSINSKASQPTKPLNNKAKSKPSFGTSQPGRGHGPKIDKSKPLAKYPSPEKKPHGAKVHTNKPIQAAKSTVSEKRPVVKTNLLNKLVENNEFYNCRIAKLSTKSSPSNFKSKSSQSQSRTEYLAQKRNTSSQANITPKTKVRPNLKAKSDSNNHESNLPAIDKTPKVKKAIKEKEIDTFINGISKNIEFISITGSAQKSAQKPDDRIDEKMDYLKEKNTLEESSNAGSSTSSVNCISEEERIAWEKEWNDFCLAGGLKSEIKNGDANPSLSIGAKSSTDINTSINPDANADTDSGITRNQFSAYDTITDPHLRILEAASNTNLNTQYQKKVSNPITFETNNQNITALRVAPGSEKCIPRSQSGEPSFSNLSTKKSESKSVYDSSGQENGKHLFTLMVPISEHISAPIRVHEFDNLIKVIEIFLKTWHLSNLEPQKLLSHVEKHRQLALELVKDL